MGRRQDKARDGVGLEFGRQLGDHAGAERPIVDIAFEPARRHLRHQQDRAAGGVPPEQRALRTGPACPLLPVIVVE